VNHPDPFHALETLSTPQGPVRIYSLKALETAGLCQLFRLPFSIRILLESLLRNAGRGLVREADVRRLAGWRPGVPLEGEVPFLPARVLMQDFTGVPAVVDLAAMRGAMQALGGDPSLINPLIPTDLVIDHSVQVDYYGTPEALGQNETREFERNRERYAFLRWGQMAFKNFRISPPSTGIVHQVNLEHLAGVVLTRDEGGGAPTAMPDSVLGTDSHTTMINGLGVLGWGVGGIEAEAAMLGQPYYMLAPEVVGVRLHGHLEEGVTATDLVLHITEMLRAHGVVGKFVEFFGPGVSQLSLPDRATVANMAPEYGATMGFFPADEVTMEYLTLTGRPKAHVAMVRQVLQAQGLFGGNAAREPDFSAVLNLNLAAIIPAVAGPKRPQDRIPISSLGKAFSKALTAPTGQRGYNLPADQQSHPVEADTPKGKIHLDHGSVVIAAITSCTNTSNPSVLISAGLLAKKAVEAGLSVPVHVKTSLAPGSRVVTGYLTRSGLLPYLEKLGFHVVGYGCTTCIGNSGPLDPEVSTVVRDHDLVTAAVLSGNRNFEGRVNPLVKANFLASPPLVVAYALAGTVKLDISTQPLGHNLQGQPVYLGDVWPTNEEIKTAMVSALGPDLFLKEYQNSAAGSAAWQGISAESSTLYPWDSSSTYIQEPPFFEGLTLEPAPLKPLKGMRLLALLGDSVTTDHISPAGSIPPESAAGRYLQQLEVVPAEFNSFGSRRGNDRVMTRGTFGNIRLKNLLVPGVEGSVTRHLPTGEQMTIFDAAMRYKEAGIPLMIIGGKEYGSGSSRDWAAKGTLLLGVRVVLAESFERIHRSNLVGMGVNPLQFIQGETPETLGLTGDEMFDIEENLNQLPPQAAVTLTARKPDGTRITFKALSRVDTQVEVGYIQNGGILPTVIRQMIHTQNNQPG